MNLFAHHSTCPAEIRGLADKLIQVTEVLSLHPQAPCRNGICNPAVLLLQEETQPDHLGAAIRSVTDPCRTSTQRVLQKFGFHGSLSQNLKFHL